MLKGRARTVTIILLTAYTVLMLYFLYIGFNRASDIHDGGYRYNLIPDGIPLYLPIGHNLKIWFFNFANFAAFLPYGILVPQLFPCRFLRFISIFLVSIVLLETVQMVTHLGSFDIDDVLINTLGAAIGFLAQQLVRPPKDSVKGLSKIVFITILLSIGTTVTIQGVNHLFAQATKIEAGKEIGLHELPLKSGSVAWETSLTGFEAGRKEVEPQMNVLSRNNSGNCTFTYQLDGKYLTFSSYSAIPDDIFHGESTVIITVDGVEASRSTYIADGKEREVPAYSEMDIQGAQELTISIMNEDQNPNINVLMWDAILTEIKK